MNHDEHDDASRRAPMRRPGSSHVEQRLGAKFLLRRLDWVFGCVVYWYGEWPKVERLPGTLYRPTRARVADRLAGLPPGLYAIEFADQDSQASAPSALTDPRWICRSAHPRVSGVRRLADRDIAEASRALRGLDRHRVALENLVVRVDAWMERARMALACQAAAMAGLGDVPRGEPGSILVEAGVWWIGPDSSRPSNRLETDELARWARQNSGEQEPGVRLAWGVLGRRRASVEPRNEMERTWYRLGATLSAWPADLLAKVRSPDQLLGTLAQGIRPQRSVNGRAAVAYASEALWWGAAENLAPGLKSLRVLLESVARSGRSVERRIHRFLNLVERAVEVARDPVVTAALKSGPEGSDEEVVRRIARSLGARGQGRRPRRRSEAEARGAVERAFHSLVGARLSLGIIDPRDWLRLGNEEAAGKRGVFVDLNRLARAAARSSDAEGWSEAWCGMAGLVSRWVGAGVLAHLTPWLDVCTEVLVPGARGDVHLRVAMRLFEVWVWVAGRDRANWERLFEVLPGGAETLFAGMRRRYLRPNPAVMISIRSAVRGWLVTDVAAVARLGRLTQEQAVYLVANPNLGSIGVIVRNRPERLPVFVDFLRRLEREHGIANVGYGWTWLFAKGNDAMLAWFEAFRARWVQSGRLNPEEALLVATAVLECVNIDEGRDDRVLRFTWVVDLMVQWALGVPLEKGNRRSTGRGSSLARRVEDCFGLLDLTVTWERHHHPDLPGLVQALLGWWDSKEADERARGREHPCFPRFPAAMGDGLVAIADGDAQRLCQLLGASLSRWFRWDLAEAGWRFLGREPGAQAVVATMLSEPEGIRRGMEVLSRIGLALRMCLRNQLERGLRAWSDPKLRAQSTEGSWPVGLSESISTLVAYRKLADRPGGWERELRNILDRPARLREERDHLVARIREGETAPRLRARLANLESYFADPDSLAEWVTSDLRKAVPRLVERARRAALERIPDRVIGDHWRRTFALTFPQPFDGDWENALLLMCELKENRALLRRLLRHEAVGDRRWMREHPGNRVWREKARAVGTNTDRWLGPVEWVVRVGGGRWRAYAENDPLRVLQMGNLFDTCLSRTGINNFSVVANAVELNKRVLYVTDGRETVIGRKLVALVPAKDRGVLLGFRSYGAAAPDLGAEEKAAGGPWVKIALDLLCGRWVREMGARFADSPAEEGALSESGALFARWYNDGVESFDWWITDTRVWPVDREEPDRDRLLTEVTLRLERPGAGAGLRFPTLRALGWLGTDAGPVVERLQRGQLRDEEMKYLTQCLRPLGVGSS